MTKWIVSVVVVIIIAVGAWFYWDKIMSVFSSPAPAPVADVPTDPTASWSTYASTTMGISIKYPEGWVANDSYAYTQVNPKKPINGVQLTIPVGMATGTNLSSDTYVAVEQLPRAKSCTGDIFVAANVTAHDVIDGGFSYSVATTTGAGAGNRYEETIYAVKNSQPCTAVRYYVHYGVLENYPAGAVQAFDRTALLNQFDQVRRTLQLTGSAPVTTTP